MELFDDEVEMWLEVITEQLRDENETQQKHMVWLYEVN
jgi:hypothetical protein